jgi:hypothetical protein
MAAEKYLSSMQALRYLADRHDVHRSAITLERMNRDGRLPADGYSGRLRRYRPASLDIYAARLQPNQPLKEGIPTMPAKDLTSKTFRKGSAGAEGSERRNEKAPLAKGGRGADNHMHGQQQATTKTRGSVGPRDVRGPGEKFGGGGYGTPRGVSKVGVAAPAEPGKTGNAAGSSRRPRDFSKEGPVKTRR